MSPTLRDIEPTKISTHLLGKCKSLYAISVPSPFLNFIPKAIAFPVANYSDEQLESTWHDIRRNFSSASSQLPYGTLAMASGNLSSISHLRRRENPCRSTSRLHSPFPEMQSRRSQITRLIWQMELAELWFWRAPQQVWEAMSLLVHLQLGNSFWELCLRVCPKSLGNRTFMWHLLSILMNANLQTSSVRPCEQGIVHSLSKTIPDHRHLWKPKLPKWTPFVTTACLGTLCLQQ